MIAWATASLNSADVALASFATAKALRSQVGQPSATAQAALIKPCVFRSKTSSYSKLILLPIFMVSPLLEFDLP
jgi:cell division inhibitor SulA